MADDGVSGGFGAHEHVLLVHAHPDDESLSTGGTIAMLVERGVGVTVLTCTRGERGEVIPPELSDLEGDARALAERREGELAGAMAALGVSDQRYLGAPNARLVGLEPRRYVDSGMQWGANGAEALEALEAQSLSAAPLGEVAADIATVIQNADATSVISYDADGGYGHPDHVMAHDAARRAAEVMGVPFFAVLPDESDPSAADFAIDVSAVLDRKIEALRAHRTQITVDGGTYALSSGPFHRIAAQERFRRIEPVRESAVRWSDLGATARVVACTLALLVGIALGGIGTVNHQLVLPIGSLRLPGGVTAALLLVAALMVSLRLVFVSRIVAVCAGVGVLAALTVLTLGGPGGSVLVPANPVGYVWTYGAAAVVALVLVWPRIAGRDLRSDGTPFAHGTLDSGPIARGITEQ